MCNTAMIFLSLLLYIRKRKSKCDACLLNHSMNELCYRIYWLGASCVMLSMSDEPLHSMAYTIQFLFWYRLKGGPRAVAYLSFDTIKITMKVDNNHNNSNNNNIVYFFSKRFGIRHYFVSAAPFGIFFWHRSNVPHKMHNENQQKHFFRVRFSWAIITWPTHYHEIPSLF